MTDADQKLNQFLERFFGRENFTPGLDRIRPLFDPIVKSLQIRCKVITVAGTNGKGETCHSLYQLLSKNYKCALWTSPHISSVTERFQFSYHEITHQSLYQLFQDLKGYGAELSYYEFLFYCFTKICAEHIPHIIILEVGLGGRGDTVNLFDADLVGLTSIGRDHQEILGNSYKKILHEKLGVTRPGKPLIHTLNREYLKNMAQKYCEGQGVICYSPLEKLVDSEMLNYSQRNQLLAHCLFHTLEAGSFPSEDQLKTISKSLRSLPFSAPKGRFEKMTANGKTYIFIGAHNLDGMREAIKVIRSNQMRFDSVLLSFSKRSSVDIENMIDLLLGEQDWFSNFVLTTFKHPKAEQGLSAISKQYTQGRCRFEPSIECAISKLKDQEQILVLGSYYFIGAVQSFITK